MTDYPKALAAAREAAGMALFDDSPKAKHACVEALHDLLAALDAQVPVAYRFWDSEEDRWQWGEAACAEKDDELLYAAPPAAVFKSTAKRVAALQARDAEQTPPAADEALADTQRAIIEAAERRGYERGLKEAPPAAVAVPAEVQAGSVYNEKQIAWELERTALGDGFYPNALRFAKGLPGVTADDCALLDRFATGRSRSADRVALQVLAVRIYHAPAQQPAAAVPAEEAIEAAYWDFDARHKGYGPHKTTPQSERDAFKWAVRAMLAAANKENSNGGPRPSDCRSA